ncbi:hypothetical protein ANN_15909 [Periplaneta americana]|uniref:Uncharacterized protein n=1 Tax=Periplaneta americana TaxID=6978 RepID=A0ABQ8SHH5_PERAM|nr:hypothetical protein ANN_15909 [Periplaneta americana]
MDWTCGKSSRRKKSTVFTEIPLRKRPLSRPMLRLFIQSEGERKIFYKFMTTENLFDASTPADASIFLREE